ncbi:hypothetical protein B9Z55_027606 [Caenorhabditis nigoni]|nr:hypothetical protein B9Z55_027606 [Caenorhabditis nigoni]
MGSFPETTAPFQRIHADFIGPLPETSRGNKHIATFVCSFSKFMIAEPSVDQTAETLCNIFTDRTSTSYHHEANGQAERANQTIEQMLRQTDSEEWDKDLQILVHAYNNSVHATTGIEPHRVIHGTQANSPLKNTIPDDEPKSRTPVEYAEQIEKERPKMHETCKGRILKQTEKQKDFHEKSKQINDVEIKVGDKVWQREFRNGKLSAQFIGPWKVIEVNEPNIVVEIPAIGTRANNRRTRVIHKNNCKLNIEEETPGHQDSTTGEERGISL